MNRTRSSRQFTTILAALLAAAGFASCESDLLATPPASVTIALVSPPVESVSYDSVTISATTDSVATVTVEYGTTPGSYTAATPRTSSETKDHGVAVSGLTPATTYYYRVVSWLKGTRSFPSAEYSFTTTANPAFLAISTGPTATPSTSSLSIGFGTNNPCTYVVEYGTSSGSYTSSTLQTAAADTTHTALLSGLAPATTFYYRLKLYWNAGDDYVSAEYSASTNAETAPTAVQKTRGIWLLGGISGGVVGSTVPEVDLFDPVTNTWYPAITSVPTPVSFAAYAAYGGKLYVIGGFNASGAQQQSVQIYDVTAGSWSTGASMTQARANINAAVIYGRVSILGGTNGAYNAAWAQGNTYYEYSIGGNSWATKLAVAGSERFSYVYDDVVYYVGGRITNGSTTTNTHEGIVFTTNTVTSGTEVVLPAGQVRTGLSGALVDPDDGPARVILIGGITGFTGTPTCFVNNGPTAGALVSTVQYLSYPFTAPNVWTPATPTTPPNYPSSIAFGAAVATSVTGSHRVYHFGGTTAIGASAGGQTSAYWIAPPSGTPPATWSESWNSVTTMPRARWGHGAVSLSK